jgi:aspartate/methionine/tyrosine aminotransferase
MVRYRLGTAARSRQIVLDNLALAEPFFARWRSAFRWNRPQAGSVALVGLRERSARTFCDQLVAEQGVLLLPSTGLGFGDGHVRFGFGRLSFPAALEQLDRYMARQESASA